MASSSSDYSSHKRTAARNQAPSLQTALASGAVEKSTPRAESPSSAAAGSGSADDPASKRQKTATSRAGTRTTRSRTKDESASNKAGAAASSANHEEEKKAPRPRASFPEEEIQQDPPEIDYTLILRAARNAHPVKQARNQRIGAALQAEIARNRLRREALEFLRLVWEASKGKKDRPPTFATTSRAHYGIDPGFCMLLGLYVGEDFVKCAHLLPHCSAAMYGQLLAMALEDVDAPGNTLNIHIDVESKTDNMRVGYRFQPGTGLLYFCVLDPFLRGTQIGDLTTTDKHGQPRPLLYKDMDGQFLQWPNEHNQPFEAAIRLHFVAAAAKQLRDLAGNNSQTARKAVESLKGHLRAVGDEFVSKHSAAEYGCSVVQCIVEMFA